MPKYPEYFSEQYGTYNEVQSQYQQNVNEITQNMTKRIREAITAQTNLVDFFYTELELAGAARQHLDIDLHGKDASLFGLRRDLLSSTTLHGRYEKYNTKFLAVLKDALKLIRNVSMHKKTRVHGVSRTTPQKKYRINEITCSNKKSYKTIQHFTYRQIEELDILTTRELQIISNIVNLPINNAQDLSNLLNDKASTRILKEKDQNLYDMCTILPKFGDMIETYRQKTNKSPNCVLITQYIEVNERMIPCTRYLSAYHVDEKLSAIDLTESIVKLFHQDIFEIDAMLQDIAIFFKQAVRWDKKNIQELQEIMALFYYEFSHAMPFRRGSAAILEWFEMSIYQYHGFSFEYDNNVSMNLEALTLPLSDFVKEYPLMIKLNPRTEEFPLDYCRFFNKSPDNTEKKQLTENDSHATTPQKRSEADLIRAIHNQSLKDGLTPPSESTDRLARIKMERF